MLSKIIDQIPQAKINKSDLNIRNGLELVGANFHISAEVDLLLGSEIFWNLLYLGQIGLARNRRKHICGD